MLNNLLFIFLFSNTSSENIIPSVIDSEIKSAIESKMVYDFMADKLDSSEFLNTRYIGFRNIVIATECSIQLTYERRNDLHFPLENYVLFVVRRENGKLYCQDGIVQSISSHDKLNRIEEYLVAINFESNQVVFIAGNIFKSRISRYFDLSNDSELKNYLILRLYPLGIEIIERKSNFEFLLKTNNQKKVIIKLDSTDFDIIQSVETL